MGAAISEFTGQKGSKKDQTADVIVIGGGASGMMAALTAAEAGASVLLLEKNEKLGRKIYITGKGRCNFTNACAPEDFFSHVPRNGNFLYSSIYGFDPDAAILWFEEHGMRTKVERGSRAFPESDHASDVTRTLERAMKEAGVTVRLNTEVREILCGDDPDENTENAGDIPCKPGEDRCFPHVCGVRLSGGKVIRAKAVIIATGGLSYPSTGSTGDGYRFAKAAGHTVTPMTPSLVPLRSREEDLFEMQGLSLRNVTLKVFDGKKKVWEGFGELMFTHFGVTGPLVLTASSDLQERLKKGALAAEIDLKPALSDQTLDARILREFEASPNKEIRNVIPALYPQKMVPVILKRTGIDPDKAVHDITKEERKSLIENTRHFHFTITGTGGYNEAVITHGGVSVREVDPGTMESKKKKGLFFSGEVLDVDAHTGGFNLQIAWATGRAAGYAAADYAAAAGTGA